MGTYQIQIQRQSHRKSDLLEFFQHLLGCIQREAPPHSVSFSSCMCTVDLGMPILSALQLWTGGKLAR